MLGVDVVCRRNCVHLSTVLKKEKVTLLLLYQVFLWLDRYEMAMGEAAEKAFLSPQGEKVCSLLWHMPAAPHLSLSLSLLANTVMRE